MQRKKKWRAKNKIMGPRDPPIHLAVNDCYSFINVK